MKQTDKKAATKQHNENKNHRVKACTVIISSKHENIFKGKYAIAKLNL